ncbi:MAG: hypothetical protein ACOYL5_14600 [Phototrophicaceae bacterium]|jgi:hypothetical protein
MAASVVWLEENRVIEVIMEGSYSLEDAQTVSQRLTDMLNAAQGTGVHILFGADRLEKIEVKVTDAFRKDITEFGKASNIASLSIYGLSQNVQVFANVLMVLLKNILQKPVEIHPTRQAALDELTPDPKSV